MDQLGLKVAVFILYAMILEEHRGAECLSISGDLSSGLVRILPERDPGDIRKSP